MKAENILGGLDICCVRKPEKNWGGKRLQRGGECPPAPPPKCNPAVYASIHAITYSRLKGCSTYVYTHTRKYMYTTGQNVVKICIYFQHSTDTNWKHFYGVYCTCVVVQLHVYTCIYMYMYTITCVGSEAKVASPVTRVDKHHKWVDVGSAHSASNNRSRVDHWALLHTTHEHKKNIYIFGIYKYIVHVKTHVVNVLCGIAHTLPSIQLFVFVLFAYKQ